MAFGGNVGPGNAGYAAPGHNSNPFLGDAGAWTGGSRDAGSGLHGFGQQQVTPTNPFTTFSAGTADYPMANRGTADVLVPVPTGASAGALRDTREVHASGQGLQSSGINTVGDPKGKGHNARYFHQFERCSSDTDSLAVENLRNPKLLISREAPQTMEVRQTTTKIRAICF